MSGAGAKAKRRKVSKQRAPMGPIEMGAGAPRNDDGAVGCVNRWALITDDNDDDGEQRKPKPAEEEAQEVVVVQEPAPLPADPAAVRSKEGKRKKKMTASKASEEEDQSGGGGRCREVAERVCKAAVAVALLGLLGQFVRDTLVAAGSLAF